MDFENKEMMQRWLFITILNNQWRWIASFCWVSFISKLQYVSSFRVGKALFLRTRMFFIARGVTSSVIFIWIIFWGKASLFYFSSTRGFKVYDLFLEAMEDTLKAIFFYEFYLSFLSAVGLRTSKEVLKCEISRLLWSCLLWLTDKVLFLEYLMENYLFFLYLLIYFLQNWSIVFSLSSFLFLKSLNILCHLLTKN